MCALSDDFRRMLNIPQDTRENCSLPFLASAGCPVVDIDVDVDLGSGLSYFVSDVLPFLPGTPGQRTPFC